MEEEVRIPQRIAQLLGPMPVEGETHAFSVTVAGDDLRSTRARLADRARRAGMEIRLCPTTASDTVTVVGTLEQLASDGVIDQTVCSVRADGGVVARSATRRLPGPRPRP
jgi:hypothetical protein